MAKVVTFTKAQAVKHPFRIQEKHQKLFRDETRLAQNAKANLSGKSELCLETEKESSDHIEVEEMEAAASVLKLK